MNRERSSGVLLHITSLPGRYGTGTLGYEARDFAEFLRHSSQKYWQTLPFNPVSGALGYSPYTAYSTFAGNPFLISFDLLKEREWVPGSLMDDVPVEEYNDFVNLDQAHSVAMDKLKIVFDVFNEKKPSHDVAAFRAFCEKNAEWLEDYAFYVALAEHFGTHEWMQWDKDISLREPAAMKTWSQKLVDRIEFVRFQQWLFFDQWYALKHYCNDRGIKLVGDIPIYVSFESADAWANPSIFQVDETTGRPTHIAGVPPDYFSATGQRWGNPLYKWFDASGKLDEKVLAWWIRRMGHLMGTVDLLRIDHFRAFESYWSIPAHEPTAMNGTWVKGPGRELFDRIEQKLGKLNLIAEDLGIITPEVEQLRDDLELPGMKIIQFAFDFDPNNAYLAHNYPSTNCVVYAGTHDNNTVNGWYYGGEVNEHQKSYIAGYLGCDNDHEMNWKIIRYAMGSVAYLSIVAAQDILGYGKEFRMNTPGIAFGNWRWKLKKGALDGALVHRLGEVTRMFNRA